MDMTCRVESVLRVTVYLPSWWGDESRTVLKHCHVPDGQAYAGQVLDSYPVNQDEEALWEWFKDGGDELDLMEWHSSGVPKVSWAEFETTKDEQYVKDQVEQFLTEYVQCLGENHEPSIHS